MLPRITFDKLLWNDRLVVCRSLEDSDPDMWHENEKGNWVVNKSNILIRSLSCNQTLEYNNRAMKIVGGHVGISQKPQCFFSTAPGLQRVSQETLSMCGNLFKPMNS